MNVLIQEAATAAASLHVGDVSGFPAIICSLTREV